MVRSGRTIRAIGEIRARILLLQKKTPNGCSRIPRIARMPPERQDDLRNWRDPRSDFVVTKENPNGSSRIPRIALMVPERQDDPRDWRDRRLEVF
jgi:hypothetical protein